MGTDVRGKLLRLLLFGLLLVIAITVVVVFVSAVVAKFIPAESAGYIYWVASISTVGVIGTLAGLSTITGITLRDFFEGKPNIAVKESVSIRPDGIATGQSVLSQDEEAVLVTVYQLGKGNTITGAVNVSKIAGQLNLPFGQAQQACKDLEAKGLA